ncbi:hypothetical protein GLOTRDRAFT_133834 [Gloeophyllum trabeum ATCC 11539]|uniref:ABC transporter domain-containing protein n=1 Tax=Gloeophyllum trabeum (strain ATCC 11539 / FP-39264 / Madison 617) TaxID=670483 RepID=S7PTS2_GLOTA|nr:uncharacterized protein GLOTRDRAFT_133834 [Gloeophyllum trabeum ATCC 11539]EPQ50732.1 hypothetical protein GLOTRDRAFT_133834 [Gloeophyllum trabeum ATCC 11539]
MGRKVTAFSKSPYKFDEKEDCLYEHLSFGIDMDLCVAILGANGAGKSTLPHLVMGVLRL